MTHKEGTCNGDVLKKADKSIVGVLNSLLSIISISKMVQGLEQNFLSGYHSRIMMT